MVLAVVLGLSVGLPVVLGASLVYLVVGLHVFPSSGVLDSLFGAVSNVFATIVGILYIAFFWIVVASVIAGGIEMASAQARPVLEMFGLPLPKATPEGGFRTMWTAVMAWIIANAIIQAMFPGVSLPSPVSIYPVTPKLGLTVGGVGTIIGVGVAAGIVIPLLLLVLVPDFIEGYRVIEL